MADMNGINEKTLSDFKKTFEENILSKPLTNALAKHDIDDVVFVNSGRAATQFQFDVDIKTLPATNQKKSGRCWIFSALNVLREKAADTCNIDRKSYPEKFELSQNYVAFWDKFEKINYFLESIIALADRPLDDRLVDYILQSGINDGGQWDMFVNVVEKYGVVPQSAMEETFQSENTAHMNELINTKLRQSAAELRNSVAGGKDAKSIKYEKEEMMFDFYSLLCMCFGEPPKTFDFEYTDKDGNYHADRDLTPKSFYEKYIGCDLANDFASLINSPTEDKPFYENVTIDWLNNVAEGRPVKYLNVPMEDMKSAIVKQLKSGMPVWFGSDVSKMGERQMGLWSDALFDYNGTLGIDFSMTKEFALPYRDSAMNHAMVITGVNFGVNGKPDRWKIENSWSDERGNKGYFVMNAGWFDKYVFQAVVKKEFMTEKMLGALKNEPKHFYPWDPVGTLTD